MSQKAIIAQAAAKYGIDPKILWGLYGTETNYGRNTNTSSAGAVGPFQFLPSTAKGMGVNPYDFKSAAYGAARYLSQYKGRGTGGMLSAYNAGPGGGYQSGYVNTTLKNAKTFGSGASGVAGATQASLSPPGAPQAQGPTFDLPGFQKAQKASVVGKLISSTEGTKENPLIASGLATTREPNPADFEIPAVPGAPTPRQGPAIAQPQHPGQIEPLLHTMNAIAQAKVPYLWGGGHAARFLPGQQVRPLDCSGAVSAALGINPKVSGEFEQWGQNGRGQHVTIYANKHHVLMEVNGHFWGTSSTNPGGGAGWIKHGAITPQYLSQFRARHPVGM